MSKTKDQIIDRMNAGRERPPVHIQRSRKKGWRKPDNTVYVGRGSKWGNPVKLIEDTIYIDASKRRRILDPWIWYNVGDQEDVVYLFEKIITGTQFANKILQYWSDYFSKLDISELKGKNLMCWCSLSEPCHTDILLKLANDSKNPGP